MTQPVALYHFLYDFEEFYPYNFEKLLPWEKDTVKLCFSEMRPEPVLHCYMFPSPERQMDQTKEAKGEGNHGWGPASPGGAVGMALSPITS